MWWLNNYDFCFLNLAHLSEFKQFLKRQGIKHIVSAPYHPSTNGLAERAVQVVKRGLRKKSHGTMHSRLATVLFAYRLTPQSTTGLSPSELLLGRRPRSHLDLLKPNTADGVDCSRQSKCNSTTLILETGVLIQETKCMSARKSLVTWCDSGQDRTCFLSSKDAR